MKTITFCGQTYQIPDKLGDQSWGLPLSLYLDALSTGAVEVTGDQMTGDLTFANQKGVKFNEQFTNGVNFFKLEAADAMAASLTFKLPAADGNAKAPLVTDGAGNFSFISLAMNRILVSDSNGGLAAATATATELTYLEGVSSSIQDQLDDRLVTGTIVNADIAAGAAIALSKLATLTASKVLVSDGGGLISASSISTTTLNFLDASSSIQGQLNTKAIEGAINNASIVAGAAIAVNKLAALTASKVLVSDGSGVISPSSITSTTLGYLDATSSVQNQIDAVKHVTVSEKTNSYVLLLTDDGKFIDMNKSTANTLTVPKNSSVAFTVGTIITIRQKGAGQVTITPVDGDVTLQSKDGLKISGQYGIATICKVATDIWAVFGSLIP